MTSATSRGAVALMIESDGPGGAERMLLQLAEELRRRGREVVPVGPAVGCGWLAAQCRARGFEPEGFTLRAPFDPGCVASLVRILRRRNVTLVHSHEFTMAVFGAAAAMLLRVPHVITMHGGLGFADRWRRRTAFRWACGRSRAVVAVSRAGAGALARHVGIPHDTLAVIPNGIRPDVPSGADVRAELGLLPDIRLLLAVGNLYPVKGHDILLRALALVNQQLPPWILAIAGRGVEAARLSTLARELGLEGKVRLLGYRADIADLLASADLFVMPSRSEGLPLALLEAMFTGLPIVATSVGGIPEAVHDDVEALLVTEDDPVALATAIQRILADPSLGVRLGESARFAATGRYSVDAMATAYEALYEGASASRREA